MKNYKKYAAEKYSFLVNDTTLSSDNLLHFPKNLLGKNFLELICNKIMAIDDQIKDKKLQMTLIEKLQKYQPYHQAKLISMNISQDDINQ